MYYDIRDYAVIGNLRSAVLISKHGSIDWACAPFIDSPSVFAALLDDEKGGYWSVKPVDAYSVEQRYIKRTNIVVTRFTTQTGTLELTDYLPIEPEKTFLPAEDDTTFKLKRRVMCTEGEVPVHVEFVPRFDYARGVTSFSTVDHGVCVENQEKRGVLVTHRECEVDEERGEVTCTFLLKEGEYDWFVFRYNTGSVDLQKDKNEHHNDELLANIEAWRAWINASTLDASKLRPEWHRMVMRSMLCLKILFFEPIGTVAAAATTSLPESIGGVRNWDYRYTWLRDSSLIFQSLFKLGHTAEAKTYLGWVASLLEEKGAAELRCMYALHSETTLEEYTLTHLKGYKSSQPVRIGNSAHLQEQWDIYGSVVELVWRLHELEPGSIDESTWKVVRAIAEYATGIWHDPDEGLWEVRGGAAHFTYSKVMLWVALDRAVRLAQAYGYEGEVPAWQNERDALRHEILTRGFSEERNSFVQTFDGTDLDASLLLLSAVGFIDGTDPKMVGTIRAIESELSCGEGLLLRYTSPDGLPGGEGAFLLASFWYIDALVHAGEVEKASGLFEKMVARANHVALFSEEMHPKTGEFLGNYPQAYTHIGLINSALLLAKHTDCTSAIKHAEKGSVDGSTKG